MAVAPSILSGLQNQSASSSSKTGLDKVAEDKAMFLKLLMAQMTNQDPLNPSDSTEFISQLTQFTSVEQLMNINTNMTSVSETMLKQQINTATNLIGTIIYAKGSDIAVSTDSTDAKKNAVGNLYAEVPQELSSLTMTVNKLDADGNASGILWSKNLGPQKAGTINAADYWDGTTSSGAKLPEGTYNVSFSALDSNGKNVLVPTKSAGLVVGFTAKEDGNHLLTLIDGRQVYLDGIELIQAYSGSNSGGSDSGGSGSGGSGSGGSGSGSGGSGSGGSGSGGSDSGSGGSGSGGSGSGSGGSDSGSGSGSS